SRRRHTRSKRDWSSDVCSSDLKMDSAPSEQPATVWYAKYPVPKLEGTKVSKDELLSWLKDDKMSGQFLLVDLRRTDYEVCGMAQIGRASCRERVYILVVGMGLD